MPFSDRTAFDMNTFKIQKLEHFGEQKGFLGHLNFEARAAKQIWLWSKVDLRKCPIKICSMAA